VAVGDTVYVTLSIDEPLTALDAATGETIRTYDGTRSTEEIINADGVLFLLVNELPNEWVKFRPKHTYVWDNTGRANRKWAWDEKKRRVMAVEASTGKVLWEKEYLVAPLTLAADQESVYFHDGEKAVCLDRKNGEESWTSEPIKRRSPMPVSFGPRLVVHKDVVVFAGGDRSMTALSAQNGKTLWTGKHARSGHQSPEDLLVVDGLVWSGAIAGGKDSGIFTGLDLYTGKVESEFPPDVETYWFHHRCYPSKATDRYLLPSRTGIEFVDYRDKHWTTHHWVRGGCIYGIMPCNGLVYAPPHSCACYIEAKLNGFCALAPESEARQVSDDDRLERGPAYGQIENLKSEVENPNDWPTYRHDPARSGYTKEPIPADLEHSWRTDLGGRLSSVVIAGDKAFVASIDTHTVYALNADTGKIRWNYNAGGRVDSPPTIYQGLVLFGSVDGWVYCLRASDGALIWRFRAAPVDQRLMAFEQLESVWPVHGSVLVQDNTVHFVAGRSMFLDGGLRLFQLDPKTGRKISETILDDRDPETGDNLQVRVKGLNMPVALPDILSYDGNYVYMRSQRFDLQGNRQEIGPTNVTEQVGEGTHLFSPVGFVDDTWFHRSYWMFGRNVASGWGGWFRAGRFVPSGRILVFDDSSVYGYGRRPEYLSQSSVLEYQLFAANKQIKTESIRRVQAGNRRMNATSSKNNVHAADWKARRDFPLADRTAADFGWWRGSPPLQVRAMVLADKTLFMAGPPDVANEEQAFYAPDDEEVIAKLNEQSEALEGKKGALLWVVSTADGKKLAEHKLDSPPVFDGMAASNGRLYLATKDGKVLCFAGK
jgi:outer membrane protein assembly factor BamB